MCAYLMPESRCLTPWAVRPMVWCRKTTNRISQCSSLCFSRRESPCRATLQSGHEGRPLLPSRVVRASGGISQFAQHRILPNLVQLPPQEKAVFRKAAGQVSPIGDPWGRRDCLYQGHRHEYLAACSVRSVEPGEEVFRVEARSQAVSAPPPPLPGHARQFPTLAGGSCQRPNTTAGTCQPGS